jgi:hypothetical protein
MSLARDLRPRGGRWPSRRFVRAPAGCCCQCWAEGGPPVAGSPYVWGYPSTSPDRPLMFYCDRHAEECRHHSIRLVPIILPAELTAALHCHAVPPARPEVAEATA